MKYSRPFWGLLGLLAIALLIQPSTAAEEKDTFLRISAEGKSEHEVFAYIKSLPPAALLRLGRELSADPIWKQPASGMEYVTSVILSSYADKAGRTASADSLIREIEDRNLPDIWRNQVMSWLSSQTRKPPDESSADASDTQALAQSLLALLTNTQESYYLRHEANVYLAYLLTTRCESALKAPSDGDELVRTIYEEHLKWLTTKALYLTAESDLTSAIISALGIYKRFGVLEASEIGDTLLAAFRHREKMNNQDKVLLAEVLVQTGESDKIKNDLADCIQKIKEDPALRRRCQNLLNRLQSTEQ